MRRRALALAPRVFDESLGCFAQVGYRVVARPSTLVAELEKAGWEPITLRMVSDGGRLGGSYALEAAATEPLFPVTRGLRVRARGLVRLRAAYFRPRRGDVPGQRLSIELRRDARILHHLQPLHWQRIRIEPDGTPVIRHMGGAVVWVVVPPMTRPVPLVPEQAQALGDMVEAFAGAARRLAER